MCGPWLVSYVLPIGEDPELDDLDQAVSRVAFHPKIPVVATACDDHTWKMWSVPEGGLGWPCGASG